MMLRASSVVALIVTISLAALVKGQEPDAKAARAAVDAWLILIDAARYAESWDAAATGFKGAVTSDRWQAAVKAARGPFGAIKSRTQKSATPTRNPPGAPEGEYIVFQFDSAYEKQPAAEFVTAVREKDGSWRIAGYFIK